jgi:hypothetical protein
MITKKSNPPKKRGKKRTRPRAPRGLQRRDALAFTLAGYQALGGPGKTSVYELGKKGVLELFKDPLGRTPITGKSGRAFLGIPEDATS